MPIPSQGHYGFHSFPVVDWFCLFIYLWGLTFPLEDSSEFGNFVITLIRHIFISREFDMHCGDCHNIPFWRWLTGNQTFSKSVTCNDYDGKLSSLQPNDFTGCFSEYLCIFMFYKYLCLISVDIVVGHRQYYLYVSYKTTKIFMQITQMPFLDHFCNKPRCSEYQEKTTDEQYQN